MLMRSILGRCTGMLAALALATTGYAAPITGDLAITGTIEYDTGFGLKDFGSFGTIVGGGSTTSTYDDGVVTGGNPIPVAFTDIGDGFEISGDGGSIFDTDFEFGTGIDLSFSVTNSSGTDSYEIFFKVDHTHFAAASGGDAFATSLLDFVKEPGGVAIPDDTYVERDTLGVGGGNDFDNGIFTFSIIVAAGGTFDLNGNWTMEGGQFDAFDADPAEAFALLSATITIDSIVNLTDPGTPPVIPEPGTWALMSLGALGFALWRRRNAR